MGATLAQMGEEVTVEGASVFLGAVAAKWREGTAGPSGVPERLGGEAVSPSAVGSALDGDALRRMGTTRRLSGAGARLRAAAVKLRARSA
jgi:hypothetical protein